MTYLFHKENNDREIHKLLKVLDEDNFIGLFQDLLKQYDCEYQQEALWKLPLYDIVEKLIQLYKLPVQNSTAVLFRCSFKVHIKQGNDVAEFVEWWEENNEKEAIVLPEDMDAIKIMTVHKSKGLSSRLSSSLFSGR